MKTFIFSSLFASFLATSMMVNGMAPAPESKYQSYVSRMSTPDSITVDLNGIPRCRTGEDYCVFTHTNTKDEYQKYSLYPLDATSATTNHNFTVTKGPTQFNQWSGIMWSDKPVRVLMTCGEGNGRMVDQSKGWATISFQKGYASFNAWNGAQGRYHFNDVWVGAAESKSSTSVEFVCPSVKHAGK